MADASLWLRNLLIYLKIAKNKKVFQFNLLNIYFLSFPNYYDNTSVQINKLKSNY